MGLLADKLMNQFGGSASDRLRIYIIRYLEDLLAVSGPAGGLATEATLISVLNAIVASDQDIEILLVRDTGNSDEVVQQITDYQTGTPTVSYKDVNGAVYVPVGPLEYLDPSGVMNLMLTELQTLNAGGQLLTEATFVAEDFASETTLNSLLTAFNGEDFATETTLSAVQTLLTGTVRTPGTLVAIANGSVAAGNKSVSFWFRGNNGTLMGAAMPNGSRVTYSADGNDTLGAIAYTVPTTGASEIIITYLT